WPLSPSELVGQFDGLLLDSAELCAHCFGQRRRTGKRPHHHLKVVDQAVVVDVQEIATVDRHARRARDPGLELKRMVTAAAVVDLADITKVLEDPQHAAQYRRGDRLA